MSHHTSFEPGAEISDAESATSFRRRWATSVAAATIFVHFLVFLVVGGWWYFIVPRVKQSLDIPGAVVTRSKVFLIQQSDFFVNYWYVFVVAAPILLACDFLLIRYLGKEYHLRAAVASGVIIAMLYLAYPLAGSYILNH
ncbi:MAG: hypothetical protein WCH39_21305 [Schlesneria sp.]